MQCSCRGEQQAGQYRTGSGKRSAIMGTLGPTERGTRKRDRYRQLDQRPVKHLRRELGAQPRRRARNGDEQDRFDRPQSLLEVQAAIAHRSRSPNDKKSRAVACERHYAQIPHRNLPRPPI